MTRDNITDKSDVGTLLTNIETMFLVSQKLLNDHSRTSLLLAIAIEGEMLCAKVRAMSRRWKIHPPFKECVGVDFSEWERKFQEMSALLDEEVNQVPQNTYCPSKHFMLDLCDPLMPDTDDEKPFRPYYTQTNVSDMIRRQEQIVKAITRKWPYYRRQLSDRTLNSLSQRIGSTPQAFIEYESAIRLTCQQVLSELAIQLCQLADYQNYHEFQDEEYRRLAERVITEPEYEGRKVQRRAKAYFSKWRNAVLKEQEEDEYELEIGIAESNIKNMKYGNILSRKMSSQDSRDIQLADLGWFLNQSRQRISIDELRNLLEQVYRIHYFMEARQKAEAEKAPDEPSAGLQPKKESASELTEVSLPECFRHSLRKNAEATRLLISICRRAGKYMGRNLTKEEKESAEGKPYIRWKWNYLYTVFKKFGFIEENTALTEFSGFLASILTGRKEANIRQSLYRNTDKKDESAIRDIEDAFSPIRRMISQPPYNP